MWRRQSRFYARLAAPLDQGYLLIYAPTLHQARLLAGLRDATAVYSEAEWHAGGASIAEREELLRVGTLYHHLPALTPRRILARLFGT